MPGSILAFATANHALEPSALASSHLSTTSTPVPPIDLPETPGVGVRIGRITRSYPIAVLSGIVLIVMLGMAIFSPLVATHDPYSFSPSERLAAPSPSHWLGTDDFGRDLYSRIVFGARTSLGIGFGVVIVATIVGVAIAIASGYLGGWFDAIVQRFVDMFMALPAVVLALALVAALGQSIQNVMIALTIAITPNFVRVVRSNVLSLKERQFIEASRCVGASHTRIMLRHILPNTAATIIVLATVSLGGVIIAESSLSFLGLGTPQPRPSWGAMLSGSARTYGPQAPWMVIFPGLALSLAVFAFNLLGDGLRDILDPRLRGSR
jgi:peptide/nickel transport system permease protein